MVLYAAAAAPLPELPELDPPAPLSVRPIDCGEEAVRPHFAKPYIYSLGAHTGCACGFAYGLGGDEDAEGRVSVAHLGRFLADAVERVGPIELYACWAGEEAEPLAERETLTPAAFSGEAEEFELPQRWFATIVPPAS